MRYVIVERASGRVLFVTGSMPEVGPPYRVDGVAVAGIGVGDVDVHAVEALPADCEAGAAWEESRCVPSPERLEARRSARDAELAAACAVAITAGVVLDVTGEALFYPTTTPTDQLNLAGVVALTLIGVPDGWVQGLTCRDSAGAWARRLHTAEQVQAVGRAVVAHVDACRARLAQRRAELAAAVTGEEIAAVMW